LMAITGQDLSGGRSLLDVGSGGGLPGIPLALVVPDLEVTLLEPRTRKADWLTFATGRLGLSSRVTVRAHRFEECGQELIARSDIVTARALAPPPTTLGTILPALEGETRLLLWHSDRQTEGIVDALRTVRGGRTHIVDYTLSYFFESIDFSSNITALRKAH